jgi:hypothetical protein
MDRWVCKRCFASNEGDAAACSTCGWPRGEVPPPEEPLDPLPAPASQPGPVQPAPWWRPLLRYWWVVGIILVGGYALVGYLGQAHRDADGRITSAGSVTLSELRVGDCFDAPSGGTISRVTGRPCPQTHAFELFAIATDSVHDSYPDQATMGSFLASACIPAFADYVGTPYGSSTLAILPVTPSEDGWSHGDRTFFCALYDPAQSRLTGSLRGSGH